MYAPAGSMTWRPAAGNESYGRGWGGAANMVKHAAAVVPCVGASATAPHVLVVGGGGVCFSYGAHYSPPLLLPVAALAERLSLPSMPAPVGPPTASGDGGGDGGMHVPRGGGGGGGGGDEGMHIPITGGGGGGDGGMHVHITGGGGGDGGMHIPLTGGGGGGDEEMHIPISGGAPVLFVHKSCARAVKLALEAAGWDDRGRRLAPRSGGMSGGGGDDVAVPVAAAAVAAVARVLSGDACTGCDAAAAAALRRGELGEQAARATARPASEHAAFLVAAAAAVGGAGAPMDLPRRAEWVRVARCGRPPSMPACLPAHDV